MGSHSSVTVSGTVGAVFGANETMIIDVLSALQPVTTF